MATYTYRCERGHEHDEQWSIGTAPQHTSCDCARAAALVIGRGVYISASVTPARRGRVLEIDATEKRWDKDLPAYKRMRQAGLQPKTTRGAAALEDRAGDQLAIDHGDLIATYGESRVRETAAAVGEGIAAWKDHL